MIKSLTLFLCAFFTLGLSAQIHFVPAEFADIQAAIDASQNGDTVVVSPGVYFENISFEGKDILLTSQFYEEQNTEHIFNTIIDGSQPETDTASVVRFIHGESADAIIQGFTIRGGEGTIFFNTNENLYFRVAGGILIDAASPTIQFNVIEDNESVDVSGLPLWAGGGGIRGSNSRSIIQNNIIRNNTGGYAGGMIFGFSDPIIRNNLIMDNNAGTSANGGGGIFIDFSIDFDDPVLIENNTIVNNHSGSKGGAIIVTGWKIHSMNNVIYGNTANVSDPQIFLRNFAGSGDPSEAFVDYTDIEGGGFPGTDNLDIDPVLMGDYFILPENSPLIDSGNPDMGYNDREEAGEVLPPALGTVRNDIGWTGGPHAFDWGAEVSSLAVSPNLPFSFRVDNPFRREGKVHVDMGISSEVNVGFLDLSGQVLDTLYSGKLGKGKHDLPFQIGQDLPAGTYLIQLRAKGGQMTKKILCFN